MLIRILHHSLCCTKEWPFVVRVAKNINYVDAFQLKTHYDYFAMTNPGDTMLFARAEWTRVWSKKNLNCHIENEDERNDFKK